MLLKYILSFLLFYSILVFPQSDMPDSKQTFKIERDYIVRNYREFNIVNSIPVPTGLGKDIAFDGEYLWVGTNLGLIHKVSIIDGEVIQTIDNIYHVGGLTFGNGFLYATDNGNSTGSPRRIHKINPNTGAIEVLFDIEFGDFTHGLEFVDGNLYVNVLYVDDQDFTFVITEEGEILNEFNNHLEFSHAIAYDGCWFWLTSNESGGNNPRINKYNSLTFEIIEYDVAPGGGFPNGLTWDGNYLWVLNSDSNFLYQIDISNCQLSIDEYNSNSISIYPNPVNDVLTIEYNNYDIENILIYDSLGKEVLKSNTNFNNLDVSHLPSGLYFIVFFTKNQHSVKKILKK